MRIGSILLVLSSFATTVVAADEIVGSRPYEMDWANRLQDDHPPLVSFENIDGWTVKTTMKSLWMLLELWATAGLVLASGPEETLMTEL